MTEEQHSEYEKKRDEEQMRVLVKEMAITNAIKYIDSRRGSIPNDDLIEIADRIYAFLTSEKR